MSFSWAGRSFTEAGGRWQADLHSCLPTAPAIGLGRVCLACTSWCVPLGLQVRAPKCKAEGKVCKPAETVKPNQSVMIMLPLLIEFYVSMFSARPILLACRNLR